MCARHARFDADLAADVVASRSGDGPRRSTRRRASASARDRADRSRRSSLPFDCAVSALLIAQWGQGNMGISMMPGAGMYPGGGMAGLGGGGALRLSPVHADPAGFGGGLGGMF